MICLRKWLENLSLMDPLTELLNRRALNELIPGEVARGTPPGGGLTFMTSVDSAPSIPGLECSRAIHSRSSSPKYGTTVFRGGDVVFRQGGDELRVLMPAALPRSRNELNLPGAGVRAVDRKTYWKKHHLVPVF
jgi:GGDEF domain-containing protein